MLDEHIAGEAKAERPSVSKAERDGRGPKSPDGRALKRLFFFRIRTRLIARPSSRTTNNGQTGNGAWR